MGKANEATSVWSSAMIVGTMAIYDFPLAHSMLWKLSLHVDALVVRWDSRTTEEQRKRCKDALTDIKKPFREFQSPRIWNRFNWRNELLMASRYFKPNILINLDHDEAFKDDLVFPFDLKAFEESDCKIAMFDYEMVTRDGSVVDKYPRARHCKMFKYEHGINFDTYAGYGIPSLHRVPLHKYQALTKIAHYCFYTPELLKAKKLHK
jgi:hypothetical protein